MKQYNKHDLSDIGKTEISHEVLYEKYQDALETIMWYEYRIRELNKELDSWILGYEIISDKYYG